MKKLTKKVWKSSVAPRAMGSMALLWVSMTLPLGPWIGGARVKLETGICMVRKTYGLIKEASMSLVMRTLKGMVPSMVIV
jgi:hypothetical protein